MIWTLFFPVMMVLAFGYMFDFDAQPKMKIGLVQISTDYEEFDEVFFTSKEEAITRLKNHGIDIVYDGQTYYINEGSPKAASASLILEASIARNLKTSNEVSENPLPPFKRQVVSTPEQSYVDWLLPGLLTLNASWGALFGIGWVIVRHRKIDVLKRLSASPVRASEYLVANMVSRVMVIVLTGVLVYWLSRLIYPFTMKGNVLEFFTVYALGALSLSSLGLIIAARTRSEEFASGVLQFVNYPLIFISEVFFSLDGSPDWVLDLAYYSPLYQTTDLMRKVMLDGHSIINFPAELSVLLVTTIVFTLIGSLMFRWTS